MKERRRSQATESANDRGGRRGAAVAKCNKCGGSVKHVVHAGGKTKWSVKIVCDPYICKYRQCLSSQTAILCFRRIFDAVITRNLYKILTNLGQVRQYAVIDLEYQHFHNRRVPRVLTTSFDLPCAKDFSSDNTSDDPYLVINEKELDFYTCRNLNDSGVEYGVDVHRRGDKTYQRSIDGKYFICYKLQRGSCAKRDKYVPMFRCSSEEYWFYHSQ